MSDEPLTILMAGGPIPAEEARALGEWICAALPAIHGELCPSAIALSNGRATIAPPGSTDRTRWGQYASPERVVGKAATGASDVFSIGAILYHALAGRPPFAGDTPTAMMLAVCTETPAPLPAVVPDDLQALVMRCLEKDAARRYESPEALARALASPPPAAEALRPMIAPPLITARGTVASTPGPWAGKRVLAADDDPPLRALYARLATQLGVDADVVGSGREAVEAMKVRKYDVALLDLNMGRVSGWEVLDFLRDRYDERPRRLYVVTGFADQVISRADRDVVSGVLYKPFAIAELRVLITECLRGALPDLGAILRTTGHRVVE